jgi:flagellin
MRELAVQAANDTNTDADRFEIQSEIKQLKAEVDRIANSTEFNTRKLLEGSARGIAEEIVGTFRMNNNSGVVVDSENTKAMMASIGKDRSWAFDGAYMLVKVNQTLDNGVAVYNANDFRLVGNDGTMYDFVELGKDTQLKPNMLKDGTIIADGGREVVGGTSGQITPLAMNAANSGIMMALGTADLANGFTLGQGVNHTIIHTLGSSSALAAGSSVTIVSGGTITLNSAGLASAGVPGSAGADSIRYNANGEMQLLGSSGNVIVTIEVGRSVTLDNGTVIRNDGGGTFSVTNGMLALGTAGISSDNASAFTISSQSILCSSSIIANPSSTTLVQATNYSIASAGAFNNNVTIGNTNGLREHEITNLKAGSVLANGSDISIATSSFITLMVNGKELEITYDAAGEILRVGDRELAAGKSLTLDDGTVITHSSTLEDPSQPTGKITVTSGKITLGKDISTAVGNVDHYTIAKDSTIAAGSQVAESNPGAAPPRYPVNLMAGTVITKPEVFFAGSITLAHNGTGMQFSANGTNSLAANYFETKVGESLTFVFSGYTPAANSINDSVMAQVGANSGQTTWVSMGDMRAKALGVDKVDISTKWGAAVAIETVNNALQKVSHQRASLGAMQNRLEHTIKNLDTAAENLQASESRIRDVDMAKEIMEYTKNSILQQASQAMLAQANQTPQSVLQLLRG